MQKSSSLTDNITIVSQILDELLVSLDADNLTTGKIPSQSLDDELLDSSINDIYESIEGDATNDYLSLVAESEKDDNEASVPLIFEASNPLIEDFFTETTQAIPHEELAEKRFDSLRSIDFALPGAVSLVPNEDYICKVTPTEFDLSLDNVFQPQSNAVDAIVAGGVEDISVSQAVDISNNAELVAVGTGQQDEPVKHEQMASIPMLIVSNISGDTPPQTAVVSDDHESLKPKKVLKPQDSLEIPSDERRKYDPTKRKDSFESKDVDRSVDVPQNSLGNDDRSAVDVAEKQTEEAINVQSEHDRDSEHDFVIVTEEEAKALQIEEQETLTKLQEQQNEPNESVPCNESESLQTQNNEKKDDLSEVDQANEIVRETKILEASSGQSFQIDDASNTSILVVTGPPQSNNINARKTLELSTIPEATRLDIKAASSFSFSTNTTSNLFTSNKSFVVEETTNTMPENEQGPIPGARTNQIAQNYSTKSFHFFLPPILCRINR